VKRCVVPVLWTQEQIVPARAAPRNQCSHWIGAKNIKEQQRSSERENLSRRSPSELVLRSLLIQFATVQDSVVRKFALRNPYGQNLGRRNVERVGDGYGCVHIARGHTLPGFADTETSDGRVFCPVETESIDVRIESSPDRRTSKVVGQHSGESPLSLR